MPVAVLAGKGTCFADGGGVIIEARTRRGRDWSITESATEATNQRPGSENARVQTCIVTSLGVYKGRGERYLAVGQSLRGVRSQRTALSPTQAFLLYFVFFMVSRRTRKALLA